MKIVLSILLILACLYIGITISGSIKKKKEFWEDVVKLCEYLSQNINFGQKKLNEILLSYKTICGIKCQSLIDTFVDTKGKRGLLESFENYFFEESEKKLLLEFFDQIGELDVYNELAKIQNYKLRFIKILDKYSEKSKKFSPLIVKLSLIFGIAICIVLI